MRRVSRRALLVGGGLGAVGLAAGGYAWTTRATADPITFDSWVKTRPMPYFVGHRGAGAVIPEHSLPGYVQAVSWVPAIEVSVVSSKDGVLFCMHDLTMDRTTTTVGKVADLTAAQVESARIHVPRLGPRWSGERMPTVPRLEAVLAAVAGKAVLCIEAKAGKAHQPMMEMLESFKMMDAVMLKASIGSPQLDLGRKRGLPLFGYLGSGEDLTQSAFDQAKAQLTGEQDALILPNRVAGAMLDDSVLDQAKRACPTVWVYSTHRRSEVDTYFGRGVVGFVSTCSGYTAGAIPPVTAPDWREGVEPGLLTIDPYSDAYAIDWSGTPGSITIGGLGKAAYVTLGEIGQMNAQTWRLDLRARVVGRPPDSGDGLVVVVCTTSDANPVVESGTGYRAVWGLDGEIRIEENTDDGPRVFARVLGAPPVGDDWLSMEVQVTTQSVDVVAGGVRASAADQRWRGGYVHLGCGERAGKVAFAGASLS